MVKSPGARGTARGRSAALQVREGGVRSIFLGGDGDWVAYSDRARALVLKQ